MCLSNCLPPPQSEEAEFNGLCQLRPGPGKPLSGRGLFLRRVS
jgi:hypothetical protein